MKSANLLLTDTIYIFPLKVLRTLTPVFRVMLVAFGIPPSARVAVSRGFKIPNLSSHTVILILER